MDEDDIPWTFDEMLAWGRWDGEQGREFNPPELRKDHPFYQAYRGAYYTAWMERFASYA